MLLALLLCAPTQDLRLPITIDAGGLTRPDVCPVTLRLPVDALPAGSDLAGAPGWQARVEGGPQSRVAQVRVARAADGAASGLELAWFEYGLTSGAPQQRLLLLQPGETGGAGRHVLVQQDGARELRAGDAALWRHELAWDPARHDETFRPYTHLFGTAGDRLTKGPGGLYPHHRGVFCGWTRTRAGEQEHNFWSVPGEPRPHQQHRGWDTAAEWTGAILARVVANTDWVTAAGEVLVEERRAWDTWRHDGRELLLDYRITLTARGELPVELRGDPAHAGFQLRLAQSVAQGDSCTYVLPQSATGGAGDNWSGAPWVAARFPIGERRYEVLFHDHPTNPRPTVFNTRSYGRFGPSFETDLAPGEPLELRYALRVREVALDAAQDRAALAAEHASWLSPVRARLD